MNISTLSDEELNRAMIWLHPDLNYIWTDTGKEVWVGPRSLTNPHWSYLLNWNLTAPLMVKHEITIRPMNNADWPGHWHAFNNKAVGISQYDKNPLRAICECILMIEIAAK